MNKKSKVSSKKKGRKQAKAAVEGKSVGSVLATLPTLVKALDKVGHQIAGDRRAARGEHWAGSNLPVGVATQMKPSFRVLRNARGAKAIGSDFFCTLTIPSADANIVGKQLCDILLNPLVMGNTRLAQLAPMFRRFRFKKFNVVFLPNQGTNTNGTIVLAYDHDAEAGGEPQGGQSAIQEAMAWNDTRTGSMWAPLQMTSTLPTPESPYWMDLNNSDTVRHNFQGQVLTLLANPVTVVSGASVTYPLTIGTLWVEYEVDLYDEQLNSALSYGYAGYTSTAMSALPTTATRKGWNALFPAAENSYGDTNDFSLVFDTSGNAGITVGRGIYTVVQTLIGAPTGAASLAFGLMTFVANIPSEQNAFGEEIPMQITYAATVLAAAAQGMTVCVKTIVVPDGGGTIYGNWAGTSGGAGSFDLGVTIQRVGQSVLRALSPPTEAGSAARCGFVAHPKVVKPAMEAARLCCPTPHSH